MGHKWGIFETFLKPKYRTIECLSINYHFRGLKIKFPEFRGISPPRRTSNTRQCKLRVPKISRKNQKKLNQNQDMTSHPTERGRRTRHRKKPENFCKKPIDNQHQPVKKKFLTDRKTMKMAANNVVTNNNIFNS